MLRSPNSLDVRTLPLTFLFPSRFVDNLLLASHHQIVLLMGFLLVSWIHICNERKTKSKATEKCKFNFSLFCWLILSSPAKKRTLLEKYLQKKSMVLYPYDICFYECLMFLFHKNVHINGICQWILLQSCSKIAVFALKCISVVHRKPISG